MRLGLGLMAALGGAIMLAAEGVSGLVQMRSAESQAHSLGQLNAATELMRGHMFADMMHDAIRSDVLASIAATEPGSPLSMSDVRADLAEHVDALDKKVAADQHYDGDPAITAAADALTTPAAVYRDEANAIAALAARDPAAARSRLPAFFTMFRDLEHKMEATSEAISNHAAKVKKQADETAAAALSASRIVSLALFILLIGLGIVVQLLVVRPIVRIATNVREISRGEYHLDIPSTTRGDEIGELTGAVISLRDAALEAERLRDELNGSERQAQQAAINRLSRALNEMAAGALDANIVEPFPEVYEPLRQHFNASLDKLAATIRDVAHSADGVRTGSGEIRTASSDLASRTERQASTLEHAASALAQTTESVQQTARNASQVNRSVDTAHGSAVNGTSIVTDAIAAMSELEQSSTEIHAIIDLIEGITFQTNLLALNAGVEAARAGEAGQGFAVVANEVRALAQRSASAASSIKQLIETSRSQVSRGVALVNESGAALHDITGQVESIRALITHIAQAVEEQSHGLMVISETVTDMDRMTQQNAAMVEQSAAASQELASEADALASLVSQFRLPQGLRRAAA